MSDTPEKPKPSLIVQELCRKLKIQLDQLGGIKNERVEKAVVDEGNRKDLFKSLQAQLNELSN
jgi:hypothetical protein